MSLRFASLDQLGKGAWKISAATPFASPSAIPSSPTNTKPTPSVDQLFAPMPHDILWNAVTIKWPQAKREFSGAVPGRRFRIDIAFPETRLAVEVDGFQHHGRFLKDFKKDRCRQNLLTLNGWRILRFSAGEIRKDLPACVEMIAATMNALSGE